MLTDTEKVMIQAHAETGDHTPLHAVIDSLEERGSPLALVVRRAVQAEKNAKAKGMNYGLSVYTRDPAYPSRLPQLTVDGLGLAYRATVGFDTSKGGKPHTLYMDAPLRREEAESVKGLAGQSFFTGKHAVGQRYPTGMPEHPNQLARDGEAVDPVRAMLKGQFPDLSEPNYQWSDPEGPSPGYTAKIGDRMVSMIHNTGEKRLHINFYNDEGDTRSRKRLRPDSMTLVRALYGLAKGAKAAGTKISYGHPSDQRRQELYAKVLTAAGFTPSLDRVSDHSVAHTWTPGGTGDPAAYASAVGEYNRKEKTPVKLARPTQGQEAAVEAYNTGVPGHKISNVLARARSNKTGSAGVWHEHKSGLVSLVTVTRHSYSGQPRWHYSQHADKAAAHEYLKSTLLSANDKRRAGRNLDPARPAPLVTAERLPLKERTPLFDELGRLLVQKARIVSATKPDLSGVKPVRTPIPQHFLERGAKLIAKGVMLPGVIGAKLHDAVERLDQSRLAKRVARLAREAENPPNADPDVEAALALSLKASKGLTGAVHTPKKFAQAARRVLAAPSREAHADLAELHRKVVVELAGTPEHYESVKTSWYRNMIAAHKAAQVAHQKLSFRGLPPTTGGGGRAGGSGGGGAGDMPYYTTPPTLLARPVAPGSSVASAVSGVMSDRQRVRRLLAHKIAAEARLKIDGLTDALVLGDGAKTRDSLVQKYGHQDEPNAVTYAAAWYGLLAREPRLVVFHVHADGPDSLHVWNTDHKPDAVKRSADALQVPHVVVGMDGTAYAHDRGNVSVVGIDKLKRGTRNSAEDHPIQRGTAHLIGAGAGSGADARDAYRTVIRAAEAD